MGDAMTAKLPGERSLSLLAAVATLGGATLVKHRSEQEMERAALFVEALLNRLSGVKACPKPTKSSTDPPKKTKRGTKKRGKSSRIAGDIFTEIMRAERRIYLVAVIAAIHGVGLVILTPLERLLRDKSGNDSVRHRAAIALFASASSTGVVYTLATDATSRRITLAMGSTCCAAALGMAGIAHYVQRYETPGSYLSAVARALGAAGSLLFAASLIFFPMSSYVGQGAKLLIVCSAIVAAFAYLENGFTTGNVMRCLTSLAVAAGVGFFDASPIIAMVVITSSLGTTALVTVVSLRLKRKRRARVRM